MVVALGAAGLGGVLYGANALMDRMEANEVVHGAGQVVAELEEMARSQGSFEALAGGGAGAATLADVHATVGAGADLLLRTGALPRAMGRAEPAQVGYPMLRGRYPVYAASAGSCALPRCAARPFGASHDVAFVQMGGPHGQGLTAALCATLARTRHPAVVAVEVHPAADTPAHTAMEYPAPATDARLTAAAREWISFTASDVDGRTDPQRRLAERDEGGDLDDVCRTTGARPGGAAVLWVLQAG